MADQEYPRKEKFFAYRLTRMMFKTALANEIGPEACHLIIQIAHTEDAARYLKPVTFYNEQLMPVCGFRSVQALDRARQRAVESGWLVYVPGGKSKAGKYWTIIPGMFADLEDGPIDESGSETTTETQDTTGNSEGKREVSGKETELKRERNGIPVVVETRTITSNSISNPNPNSICSEPEIPPSEPPVLVFPTVGKGQQWELTQRHVDDWQLVYGNLNVADECRHALEWVKANWGKRKTPKGMPAFLVNWFNRAVERLGASPRGHPTVPQSIPDTFSFTEEELYGK